MDEKTAEVFTQEQYKQVRLTLAQVLSGRGKKVEDISKQIHETMFPLTDRQIKAVDEVVESFVYGGGVQEDLPVSERLDSGLNYIVQKIIMN